MTLGATSGAARESAASRVDLPALGKPTKPTSATVRITSERLTCHIRQEVQLPYLERLACHMKNAEGGYLLRERKS